MKLWPFKKGNTKKPRVGEFDSLVWETNTLAKVALMPIVNRFPDYEPIVDSELVEVWDGLMTVAMTGVAVHAEGKISDPKAQQEIKKSLNNIWKINTDLFDDYYEYTKQRTQDTGASWSGVSAMWVADYLRLQSNANTSLKMNARKLDFINRLAGFMNVAFGSIEVGFTHCYWKIAHDVEKDTGIDMGFGTQGTKKDSLKKVQLSVEICESFAKHTVELIAAKQ
jgi:hypothetical protein